MQMIVAHIAPMNLGALEIFIEVMNAKSFTKVAKNRNVAPSSISRTISNIENELGIRLFQRTTRTISPTEAGQTYFLKILPLLNDLKQASENAIDIEQSPQGKLRITSSVSFGHHVVIPLLNEFMEAYPEITLDYVLTDRTVDIISEKIDVAIRHGTLEDSSLIASKLLETQYRLVASPDYITKHDSIEKLDSIACHELLVFDIPQFRSNWTFQKKGHKPKDIAVNSRYIISNALSLRALTLQGAGIGILANWLVDNDIRDGKLIHLFPEHIVTINNYDRAIHLVTPSRSYLPKRTRVFIDFLKNHLYT